MKVVIKSWNGVATWRWKVPEDDVCGICQNHFDYTCPVCKFPGDGCPLRMSFATVPVSTPFNFLSQLPFSTSFSIPSSHRFHLRCILLPAPKKPLLRLAYRIRQMRPQLPFRTLLPPLTMSNSYSSTSSTASANGSTKNPPKANVPCAAKARLPPPITCTDTNANMQQNSRVQSLKDRRDVTDRVGVSNRSCIGKLVSLTGYSVDVHWHGDGMDG